MATAQGSMAAWDLDAFLSTIHESRVALWSWHPEARYAVLDPLARRLWGGLEGERHPLETLFARVHDADRDAMRAAWTESAGRATPYEFEFRVTDADGETRWISARGVGGEAGRRGEEVLAVFVDVTRQREAAELQARLVGEMAHRTANLFTVAQSMTRLAANEAEDVASMATELERRFTGLAGAYRFAVTETGGLAAAPLSALITQITAPFHRGDAVEARVPDVRVRGEHITNIAIVLHELTTNALKYGALSVPDGKVSVEGSLEDGTLRLDWHEAGGPRLSDLPTATGFGFRIVEHTVETVFGGTMARRIEAGALAVTLTLDASRLAA